MQASKERILRFEPFKGTKKVRSEEALRRMDMWASAEDKVVVNVEGEGNCMYRALSYHLFGTEALYSEVRAEVVTRALHSKCIGEEWTDALSWDDIEDSAQDGQWGGQEMLKSAAETYGINIVLFDVRASMDGETHEFVMEPSVALRNDTIHIMHYLNHFWIAAKRDVAVQALEVVKGWLAAQGFGDFPFLFANEEERSEVLWNMPPNDISSVLAVVNIAGVCR